MVLFFSIFFLLVSLILCYCFLWWGFGMVLVFFSGFLLWVVSVLSFFGVMWLL